MLDEASYVDIVALCQFLPGPASSQVGFAIGALRAGIAFAIGISAFLALVFWKAPPWLVVIAGALGAALLRD
jgi:chromate transporter